MVLTSNSTGMNSFIMELEKEFTLSDDMTTDSFTFRIHNPGKVSLSWKFDNDAVGVGTGR